MLWLLCCVWVLEAFIGDDERIQVNVGQRTFVDHYGRTRLFHGVNLASIHGDHLTTGNLTDADINWLSNLGFTVVRFAFLWQSYETAPGVFNETYLDSIAEVVDRLRSQDIFTILDFHQDQWSPLYCGGHGLPEFYGGPRDTTSYRKAGNETYPKPLMRPTYGPDTDPYQRPWGHFTGCGTFEGRYGTPGSYATWAVGSASQRLYDNAEGLAEGMGRFWRKVAERFRGMPSILAYEVINEPWLGDVPLSFEDLMNPNNPHRDLWWPGVSDRSNLMPLYDVVHSHIRDVDNHTILMVEPATGGNYLDAFPVGFPQLPGGINYRDRSALSYHVYCPWLMGNASGVIGWVAEQLGLQGCNLYDGTRFDVRNSDTVRLGVGGFMTEFGVGNKWYNSTVDTAFLQYAGDVMDKLLHGWAYWDYASLRQAGSTSGLVRALSRGYPFAVSGEVHDIKWDSKAAVLKVQYRPSRNATTFGQPTWVYYNEALFYPNGTAWSAEPNVVRATCNLANGVLFYHLPTARNVSLVTLTITPKTDRHHSNVCGRNLP